MGRERADLSAIYKRYLISVEWKWKRFEKIKSVGKRCERCRSAAELQVHHKTYKRFGKERMEDLEVLCKTCHESIHCTIAGGIEQFLGTLLRGWKRQQKTSPAAGALSKETT